MTHIAPWQKQHAVHLKSPGFHSPSTTDPPSYLPEELVFFLYNHLFFYAKTNRECQKAIFFSHLAIKPGEFSVELQTVMFFYDIKEKSFFLACVPNSSLALRWCLVVDFVIWRLGDCNRICRSPAVIIGEMCTHCL